MAKGGSVEGMDEVLGNLNREIEGIKDRSIEGLLKAGLWIEGESKRLAPIDTGNLRASAYTRAEPGGAMEVEIGYSAAYAVFVHENLEQKLKGEPRRSGSKKGKYWESGEPKFLEKPLRRRGEILDIIREEAEIRD